MNNGTKTQLIQKEAKIILLELNYIHKSEKQVSEDKTPHTMVVVRDESPLFLNKEV